MSKTTTRKPLNARQRRFIDAVVEGQSASAAALRAGYRMWAARQTGYDLMQRPDVQEAVARGKAARAARLTREGALEELAAIAYSNILDFAQIDDDQRLTLDLSKMDRAAAAGVRELTVTDYSNITANVRRRTVRVRMGNKPYALRLLLANLPPTENAPGPAIGGPQNAPKPDRTRPENILQPTGHPARAAENTGEIGGNGGNSAVCVCGRPARPPRRPHNDAPPPASTAP